MGHGADEALPFVTKGLLPEAKLPLRTCKPVDACGELCQLIISLLRNGKVHLSGIHFFDSFYDGQKVGHFFREQNKENPEKKQDSSHGTQTLQPQPPGRKPFSGRNPPSVVQVILCDGSGSSV